MSFENPNTERNSALLEISNIKQQVLAMGANDTESNQLDSLIEQLNNNEISPTEAVRSALAIRDAKQAYH